MNFNINKINEDYFGTDDSKTYIKDDFSNVLLGLIQLSIIRRVLQQAASNKLKVFSRIAHAHQNGFMLDMRQLLTSKEAGAGGKFIKELSEITESQFVDNHEFNCLIQKAKKFHSKGYFTKIIKKYEEQEFHKDRRRDKYCVDEYTKKLGSLVITHRTKRKKHGVEIDSLVSCLEEFSEIVIRYQELVHNKTSFDVTGITLQDYIEDTFSLFSVNTQKDTRKKEYDTVKWRLPKSIKLMGFR